MLNDGIGSKRIILESRQLFQQSIFVNLFELLKSKLVSSLTSHSNLSKFTKSLKLRCPSKPLRLMSNLVISTLFSFVLYFS